MFQDDEQHIYYNAKIDNPIDGQSVQSSLSTVYNKQTQPILRRQSNYEMAVESWAVRCKLPVFVCPIKAGATGAHINVTPFVVNYRYVTPGGVETNYPFTIIYQPDLYATRADTPFPKKPSENNGLQDFDTNPDYYNVNSIERFVNMVNHGLKSAYVLFNAVHGGLHASEVFIKFDPITRLFSLIYPYSYVSAVGVTSVGMDALLYKYFDSIPASFNAYDSAGMDYVLTLIAKPGRDNSYSLGNHYAGAVTNPTTNPPSHLISTQESDSRHLWSNVKHVLITSSSINMRNEYMPVSSYPQEIIKRIENPFNQSKLSVISYIDYVQSGPEGKWSTNLSRDISHQPKVYKWVDLVGDSELNNVQIEFHIVMEDGRIVPMNLPRSGEANLKLVFRKKRF
tara:strand:+ start:2108 stop:3295 length:1188 start_codon:yes stop_codon:yes gene_type:complete